MRQERARGEQQDERGGVVVVVVVAVVVGIRLHRSIVKQRAVHDK